MSASAVKNVLVVGASGNVGKSTLKALSGDGFQVTGLSRNSPVDSVPAGVKFINSDYSPASLADAFKGQDAVISTVSSTKPGALDLQKSLIDTAIAAGVKIFVPSEYGVDTSDRSSPNFIPFLADKIAILDYLRECQDKISWTALVTGSLFDWGLKIPGFGGWDLGARTVTIYDGGDIPYEATTLDQVGRGIAKSLKNPDLTRNQFVYVNSFTVTQNDVLRALEKITGEKFTVSQSTVEDLWQGGDAQLRQGQPLGVLAMIAGTIYGKRGLANYSTNKGLWNQKIGLAQENLEEVLKSLIAGIK
ncbi:NmrA-like family protein [Diaporthe sp. PMI_573]|nr:NmrA-like family protein [Diaporthaceae sp. PMI_573]